jgi:triosephosphate isomerase
VEAIEEAVEVRISDLEETVVEEVIAVVAEEEVAVEVIKVVVVAPEMIALIKLKMKTAGTKIQVIAQDLHTEIRIDSKLKYIG